MNEEVKKQIARIMQAPVSGLMKLNDHDFEFVLALVYAARFFRPPEVKPVKRRKVKE